MTHLPKLFALIRENQYRFSRQDLFADFCELAAIAISNAVDVHYRDKRESRYLQIIRRYPPEIAEAFPRILAELILALENTPRDVLGETFHELELHKAIIGQFFTPYHVCRAAAHFYIEGKDLRSHIDEHGLFTAQEPACGSGAMIIALADAIKSAGVNYQQHFYVEAWDIDRLAAHMAYVQLSLLHIPASVVIGNSLSQEVYERWYTPAYITGLFRQRLRRRQQTQETTTRCDVVAKIRKPDNESQHVTAGRHSTQMSLF